MPLGYGGSILHLYLNTRPFEVEKPPVAAKGTRRGL